MGVRRGWLPRFTKGLVTDRIGVNGALLEARDVIPQRGGELWKRQPVEAAQPAPVNALVTGRIGLLQHHGTLYSSDADTIALVRSDRLMANKIASYLSSWTYLVASATFHFLKNEIGGTALFGANLFNIFSDKVIAENFGREVVIPAVLYVSSPVNVPLKWAGSTQPFYNTGTITWAAGSDTIAGIGTAWTSAMVGQYVWLPAQAGSIHLRSYRIVSVASAISMVVDKPAASGVVAQPYSIQSLGILAAPANIFGQGSTTSPVKEAPAPTNYPCVAAQVLCSHRGRLYAFNLLERDANTASGAVWAPDRSRWSGSLIDGTNAITDTAKQYEGAERWEPNARRDIYPGVGGRGGVVAAASYNGRLYIFKRRGTFVLQGPDDVLGTDLGASIEVLSDQDGAATRLLTGPLDTVASQAVTVTPFGVICAGYRGVWLCNEGGMRSLTDDVIGNEYRDVVQVAGGSITTSYCPDTSRIIVQIGNPGYIAAYRTYVYYIDRGAWVVKGGEVAVAPLASKVVTATNTASGVSIELAISQFNTSTFVENWNKEIAGNSVEFTAAHASRPKIVTHPFQIAGSGYNARIRAALVNGWVSDPGFPDTDPLLEVSVIPGEEGTNIGNDGIIVYGSIADTDVVGYGEAVHRIPGRVGMPPNRFARIGITQINRSSGAKIYEVGFEVTDVGRIR